MSVRGATFLGIGSMVGAGIFALLGEAGAVAGSAVWLSFLLAGLVAGLLGYTVVKLGVRYPSSGGLFEYLLQGFGNGRLLGIAAWLVFTKAIATMSSVASGSPGYWPTIVTGSPWRTVMLGRMPDSSVSVPAALVTRASAR